MIWVIWYQFVCSSDIIDHHHIYVMIMLLHHYVLYMYIILDSMHIWRLFFYVWRMNNFITIEIGQSNSIGLYLLYGCVCVVLRLPNRFSSLIQDTNRHPNQQIVRALLMVCCFQIQKKKYSWQLCASDVWMTIDMISSKCVYLYLFWIFFFYLLQ